MIRVHVLPPDWAMLGYLQATDEAVSWCHGVPLTPGMALTIMPEGISEFTLSPGTHMTLMLLPVARVQSSLTVPPGMRRGSSIRSPKVLAPDRSTRPRPRTPKPPRRVLDSAEAAVRPGQGSGAGVANRRRAVRARGQSRPADPVGRRAGEAREGETGRDVVRHRRSRHLPPSQCRDVQEHLRT